MTTDRTSMRTAASNADMTGRIVLITGATGGIGRATAVGIARLGATVVIVGRDSERARTAVAQIRHLSANPAVEVMLADLSSQAEIHRLARDFMDRHGRLDVLINNVGALFAQRQETVDGLEATLAINHLGPFLLTHLLLPALARCRGARIVNVNSEGHRAAHGIDFDDLQKTHWRRGFPVYAQAKLASLLFTYELARRLEDTGITVNALHPGLVDTDLVNRFVRERFFPDNRVLNGLVAELVRQVARMRFKFIDVERAARTPIYLASSTAVEGVTGEYFDEFGQRSESSPASHEPKVAERLWRVSAALTGLDETAADRFGTRFEALHSEDMGSLAEGT
jgi:NAD(P)-dependent dehydrogenase (short-subunit alcohol dehydrogenase family)